MYLVNSRYGISGDIPIPIIWLYCYNLLIIIHNLSPLRLIVMYYC